MVVVGIDVGVGVDVGVCVGLMWWWLMWLLWLLWLLFVVGVILLVLVVWRCGDARLSAPLLNLVYTMLGTNTSLFAIQD